MLFKDINIVDEEFQVREHMYVGTKGSKIAYISSVMPEEDYGEVYEGDQKLLIPAFYNAHSHLPMFLLRGYAENLPLMDWLQGKIFPFEGQMTDEDMYYGCLMGIAEMLRYGIAGSSEMYLSYNAVCRAFAESEAKGNLSRSTSCFDDSSFYDLPHYPDAMEAIREYQGYDDGRIKVEFALHSEYTTTEKVARELAEAAAKYNTSIHVHVSESQGEVDQCRQRHEGRSPVRYLADCGIFDVPVIAAHCVHVDEEDMAILKEHQVTVATNPKSNLKLASGICPVADLLSSGINVAIGTDSVASNNNLNMVEEMRFMNLLQKGIRLDPTAITPRETLYAATRAGALGQQRMDCGLIREGYRADLTVFDLDQVYMKPVHNILNNLIYSAAGNDVVLTMADGKVLYRDGAFPTIDIERVNAECEKRRIRILGALAE